MNNFLHDLALAHQKHEGYYPGSKSYRQNNPGNLRDKFGVFITFKTYAAGFAALMYDLKVKILGTAGSILRFLAGTGMTYEQLTFQHYVSIYAPAADNNAPVVYCDSLCKQLAQYNVRPGTPLSVLAKLVNGEIDRVPDPAPQMTLEQRLASATNALRWAIPPRRNMLLRLIDRLNRAILNRDAVPVS